MSAGGRGARRDDALRRAPAPARTKTIVRLVLSAGLAVVLVWALVCFTKLDLDLLLDRSIRPGFLLTAACSYLFVALTRALRFRALHHEIPQSDMRGWFQVAVIHAALNQILPLRTGEASYVYLMRRAHGCTVGRSLLVLLVSRLFDLLIVFIYCLAFLPLVSGSLGVPPGLAAGACLGVIGAAILMLAGLRPAVFFAYGLVKRRWPAAAHPVSGSRGRLRERLARLVAEAEMFRDTRHFIAVFSISGAMWTGLFVTFFGLLNGFGFAISLPGTVVGSIGAVLAGVLPVNALAGIGTQEAGWTLGLMLLGFDRSEALAAGIWSHAGLLALSFLLGLVGYLWLTRTSPSPKSRLPRNHMGT